MQTRALGRILPLSWRHRPGFLIGRHEISAPDPLAEECFELMEASHEESVWSEHSGHTRWVSEPGAFVQAMVDVVLAQAQQP